MKAFLTTKKVSIYCSVLHKNKYYEASGTCSLSWELSVDHNVNEIHGIKLYVPNQKVQAQVYFVDDKGDDVSDIFEVEITEAKVQTKAVLLNLAVLPESIELNSGEPIIYFSNDPFQPF